MAKLNPVSYGKDNNVHMIYRKGKKDQVVIRLTTFFDTATAYILDVEFKVPRKSIDFQSLKNDLEYELDKYDFALDFSEEDWNNRDLSTADLIKKKQLKS